MANVKVIVSRDFKTPIMTMFRGKIAFSQPIMKAIGVSIREDVIERIQGANAKVSGERIKQNSEWWRKYKQEHGAGLPDHSLVAFNQTFIRSSAYNIASKKNDVKVSFSNRSSDVYRGENRHFRGKRGSEEGVLDKRHAFKRGLAKGIKSKSINMRFLSPKEKVTFLYKMGYTGWFGVGKDGKDKLIGIVKAYLMWLLTGKLNNISIPVGSSNAEG